MPDYENKKNSETIRVTDGVFSNEQNIVINISDVEEVQAVEVF